MIQRWRKHFTGLFNFFNPELSKPGDLLPNLLLHLSNVFRYLGSALQQCGLDYILQQLRYPVQADLNIVHQ